LKKNYRGSDNQTQVQSMHHQRSGSSSAEWEMIEGRSTKRYEERTVMHIDKQAVENLSNVLETLEMSPGRALQQIP
jgi:hypothetical protein